MQEEKSQLSLSQLSAFIFARPKDCFLLYSLAYLVLFVPIGLYPNQFYYMLALNPLKNTIQNPMQDWRIADYFHNLLFHLLLKIVPYTPSYKLFISLHLLVITIAIIIGAFACLAINFVIEDNTRVTSLLLCGVPFVLIHAIQARGDSDWLPWGRNILIASLLLGATAPKVMVWSGQVIIQSSLETMKILF